MPFTFQIPIQPLMTALNWLAKTRAENPDRAKENAMVRVTYGDLTLAMAHNVENDSLIFTEEVATAEEKAAMEQEKTRAAEAVAGQATQ